MRIGLIAGSGRFPIIFSDKARSAGYSVVAAAYLKEAENDLKDHVDFIEWLHLGQVGKLIKYFKSNGIKDAVMLGGIRKTNIFTDVKPDIKAIKIMAGLAVTHDDRILRAFAGALEKEGIRVRASTFLLPELLAEEGCWTKRKPSRTELADIEVGWPIAKAIGRLDIGQSLVLSGGTVVAVEAVEGTDEAIRRGGTLSGGHAVVVKVCKPNQDTRFDIPAVGAQTIATMIEAGASVLALEAGKAVVFDREIMIEKADEAGIAIVALKKD